MSGFYSCNKNQFIVELEKMYNISSNGKYLQRLINHIKYYMQKSKDHFDKFKYYLHNNYINKYHAKYFNITHHKLSTITIILHEHIKKITEILITKSINNCFNKINHYIIRLYHKYIYHIFIYCNRNNYELIRNRTEFVKKIVKTTFLST